MTESNTSVSTETPSFNLKHRITGAGVLIFFGVLILPWLLGPPTEAQKVEVPIDKGIESEAIKLHSTFEDEVLAQLEGVDSNYREPEETVYVSKITPVTTASESKKAESNSNKQADSKGNTAEPKQTSVAKETSNKVESKSAQEKPKQSVTPKTPNKVVAAKKSPSDQAKTASKTKTNGATQIQSPVEKNLPKEEPQLDVGWVVQVELLVDKAGANRLVDRLKQKGFSPKTTIVDTNRGAKTGTRIWLGPYADRVSASKQNDKLENSMGKKGFIRVYP